MNKIWITIMMLLTTSIAYANTTYHSDVNFDATNKKITGTITIDNLKEDTHLNISSFYNLTLDGRPVLTRANIVQIPAGKKSIVTYERDLQEYDLVQDDFMSFSGISPILSTDVMSDKTWTITLPKGFKAISEANEITEKKVKNGVTYTFKMDKPLESIDIIASSDYVVKSAKAGDTKVYAYFFEKDKKLIDEYLEYTVDYIKMYEKLLDVKFPYERFSVVEHIRPYGYATPTYTVLGDRVINLPFIKSTSLGHEVLHQWFGSSVMAKFGDNFFEAITAYLADHYYTLEKDNGDAYRKNTLLNYDIFASGEPYPLSHFRYNGSKKDQSIGYGKGLMLFHMIRLQYTQDEFMKIVGDFVKKYEYKRASWADFMAMFNISEDSDYYQYWLNSNEIPQISASEATFSVVNGSPSLSFTLERVSGTKEMGVPYTIFYGDEKVEGYLRTKIGKQIFDIPLKHSEFKFVIDADYDIMRALSPAEIPASFSRMMMADNTTLITNGDNTCNIIGITQTIDAKDITVADLTGKNVVICGYDNPIATMVFGKKEKSDLTTFEVVQNPLSSDNLLMVVDNPTEHSVMMLRHYGKYNKIAFDGRKNVEKVEPVTDYGIIVYESIAQNAVLTKDVLSVDEVADIASGYKAIYIGETHTNYAHHLNQLAVIKRLHESGKKIAVAFEMVQKQYQDELDKFVAGKIDERTFLHNVDFFERWSFDYNLYAPLFRYIRDNKIDAIALNIDGAINRSVARGTTDNLTMEQKAELPKEMRIINERYSDELGMIFSMHGSSVDERKFANFYLAQNTWDEVMAESAVAYQKENPDTIVVFIVGSGHGAKHAGIPLRYERLTGNKAFVIVQDGATDDTISDAVIFTNNVTGEETPKIGVSISQADNKVKIEAVAENSPAEKGGLLKGDVIMYCNGHKITKIGDLKYELFALGYGKVVNCTIDRGGRSIDVNMLLEKMEEKQNPHGAMGMPVGMPSPHKK